jgi:hypothetical protein
MQNMQQMEVGGVRKIFFLFFFCHKIQELVLTFNIFTGEIAETVGVEWFKERIVPLLEAHMGAQKINLQEPRKQADGSSGKYMRPVIGEDGDSENVVAVSWTVMPKGGYLRRQAVMRAMSSIGKLTELEPVVVRFLERGLKDKVFNVQIVALRSVMNLLPALGASETLK